MKTKHPGGRPKGSRNKVAPDLRECIREMIENYLTSNLFYSDLQVLSPKERADALLKTQAFLQPKLRSVEVSVTGDNTKRCSLEDELRKLAEEYETGNYDW